MQFLHYLLRAHPEAPLLVVATARREQLDQGHPLHDLLTGLRALERVVEVEVGRLSREETAALAERLLRHPLGGAEADRLFAETEGSPLFVVEALRAGWSGQDEPAPMTPRVQAVIESRLAQLSGPARDLVGVAATIGREFSTDVLAEASQTGEAALVDGLDELWRRRLVRDQGPDGYDFTHDRVREVAYLGLSPARRRQAHALVARALKRLHASDPSPVAAQVAAHHERAGAVEDAMDWYERAAAAAQRLPELADGAVEAVVGLAGTITSPLSYVVGLAMGSAAGRVDPDATAVGERGNGFELSILAGWPPPDPAAERHVAWVREGWTALRPYSSGVYPHFLSDEGPAGLQAAYGSRLRRLTALKDRWDSTNFFRLNANIPPGRRYPTRPAAQAAPASQRP